MIRTLCLQTVLALLTFAPISRAQEPDIEQLDFFETKIRPVLVNHCYECHSAKSEMVYGGLLLDSRDSIRQGGDSGQGIVPGDLDESLVLEAMKYESYEMPPDEQLPDHVIADFEKWISEGAVDPRESAANSAAVGEIDLKAGRKFWAFQPITLPTPPPVKNDSQVNNAIDQFVLSRLQDKALAANPAATPQELLRRIYFDLVGLPPPADLVADGQRFESETELDQLVDDLIASPEFGEKWARHWLDVARYSDSSGGGRLLMFYDAWRYRDYVIDAYNKDKPFNQFVVEQLAGDLLQHESHEVRGEQITATGFLMLGPHNYELQDKELLRMEIIDEQIDVMGRSFLGMTLGCVRCHDHKFDPIPIEDYYALAGIFRGTQSSVTANVSQFVQTDLPLPDEQQQTLDEHRTRLKAARDDLNSIKQLLSSLQQSVADEDFSHTSKLRGTILDEDQATLVGNWVSSDSVKPFIGSSYRYANGVHPNATYEFTPLTAGHYAILTSYTPHPNRSPKVQYTFTQGDQKSDKVINQKQTPATNGFFQLLQTVELSADELFTVKVQSIADGAVIIDAIQLVLLDESELADPEDVTYLDLESLSALQDNLQRQTELEKRIQRLKKNAPASPGKAMSVREHSETGDYFVCIRGDAHKLGDQVPRRGLSVFPASQLNIPKNSSGRLELAEWLVADDNPLTARVYVNRVWSHLLGQGLVRTPDNFGAMGEKPSHPELLDYLASEFVKHDWSTKWLVKEIINSATYRRSSNYNEALQELDPENRLLWRANHRRLNVESLRDSILNFSGQLDQTRGGASIDRSVKREFDYQYESLRRTIYLPVFRNSLHDMLDVFDFANPNIVSGRRSESTLPSQALYLMNSPFVIQQSRLAATRLLAQKELSDEQRIVLAWQRALGRPPNDQELEIMQNFIDQSDPADAEQQLAAWADLCQTLIASLDFRYLK